MGHRWPPQTFVHVAGNASHNRDGTKQVLEAAKYLIGTDARLVVYAGFNVVQTFGWDGQSPVEFRGPVAHRSDLYQDVDCMVCPRRIGGHSLPVNEALGLGLPVITLNLSDWRGLPYTVPAHAQSRERYGRGFCDVWQADPKELGVCLRHMATGQVSLVPGPSLPSWGEFLTWWGKEVGEGKNSVLT